MLKNFSGEQDKFFLLRGEGGDRSKSYTPHFEAGKIINQIPKFGVSRSGSFSGIVRTFYIYI